MSEGKFKKKSLVGAVEEINSGIVIDETDDLSYLEKENFRWEDLEMLRTEIGTALASFSSQIYASVVNEQLISNLGERREEFDRTINLLISDIQEFSKKVSRLSNAHKGKEGKICNLEEYGIYNRCSMEYNSSFIELTQLVTPSISKLMLLTAEVIDSLKEKSNKEGKE